MSFFYKHQFWVKCVGAVWSVLAVSFLFFTVSYYLGNHDFRFVRYGIPLSAGMFEGRFSQFLPSYFLVLGEILPLLNIWLGFLFLAVGGGLLAWWYGFKKNAAWVVCFGVLIAVHPYLVTQLYYVHSFLSICCWEFCCIAGVILIYRGVCSLQRWNCFLGTGCLVLSLGGYASSLELVSVLFLGKIWLDFLAGKTIDRLAVVCYLKTGVVIGISFLVYAGIIFWMKKNGVIIVGMYNVQVMPFEGCWQRFMDKWYKPFEVLWSGFLFSSGLIKTGILLLVCAGGATVIWQKKRVVILLCLLLVLVWSAFGLAYVSPFDFFYTFRIHALSVPYLWGVVFAGVVLNGRVWQKNLSFLGAVICICGFLRADFLVQKIWYLGNNQDDRLFERIRQDIMPEIVQDKSYRLSTMGEISGREKFACIRGTPGNLRDRYREIYTFPYFINIFFSEGLFLYEGRNPILGDGLYLGETIFYGVNNPEVKREDKPSAEAFAKDYGTDHEEMLSALLKLRPYPKRNYYFIGEKDIFLMFEGGTEQRRILLKNIREAAF